MRGFFTTTALALCISGAASAQEIGTWRIGLGGAAVSPNAGPSHGIEIGNNVRPTLTAEYFFLNDIGVELLAAWPFKHKIEAGGFKIGTTKQLPPTLSMNYYFRNKSNLTPFIGAGLNYTFFSKEKTTGYAKDLGLKLKLKDSFGYALHAGLDVKIDQFSTLRADIRYLDIDTKVKVNGQKFGKVKVDPFVFGASYLISF